MGTLFYIYASILKNVIYNKLEVSNMNSNAKNDKSMLKVSLAVCIPVVCLFVYLIVISSVFGTFDGFKAGSLAFLRALCFNNNISYGQISVVSGYISILFYESLVICICATAFFAKVKNNKKAIATIITTLGFWFFLYFIDIIYAHKSADIEYFFMAPCFTLEVILCVIIIICVIFIIKPESKLFAALNYRVDVFKKPSKEEKIEEAPVEEEKVEEAAEEPAPIEPKEEKAIEEEKPVDEPKKEEKVEEAPEEADVNPFDNLGKRRKVVPFENRIKKVKPETLQRYKEMVAELRKYDFNDRFSIPAETFSYKKNKLIVFTISGQTLKVYFKLNPKDYENSTIPVKDASEVSKYEATPSYLVIKSDLASRRALALAKTLIDEYKIPEK